MPDFTSFKIMGQCRTILDYLKAQIKTTLDSILTKSTTIENNVASILAINKAHGSLERSTAGSQNWTCPQGVYHIYATIILSLIHI